MSNELIREVISDLGGLTAIKSLKASKLELPSSQQIQDVLITDIAYVMFVKSIIRRTIKNNDKMSEEMMDTLAKFISKVVVKYARKQSISLMPMLIETILQELASMGLDMLIMKK